MTAIRLIAIAATFAALAACSSTLSPPTGSSGGLGAAPPPAGFTTLHRFKISRTTESAFPTGITWLDGHLWGTTDVTSAIPRCGAVFDLDPVTQAIKIYPFDDANGCFPSGSMIAVGSELWGTTQSGGGAGGKGPTCTPAGCGAVFAISPTTGAIRVVHGFQGPDGARVISSLTLADGLVWGTAQAGGNDCAKGGCGTIFTIDPKNGAYKTVYAFQNGDAVGVNPLGALTVLGNTAYGTTNQGANPTCGDIGCGAAFQFTKRQSPILLGDLGDRYGFRPNSGLLGGPGTFFGLAAKGGGTCNCGTLFSVTTNKKLSVLHTFEGGQDGATPNSFVMDGTTLYGSTVSGGGCSTGCGTLFSFDTSNNAYTVLFRFKNIVDGSAPGPITIVNGTIYGVTTGGNGSVFQFVTQSSAAKR